MKFLKIVYDISNEECKFIPIDGKSYAVTQGLCALATERENGVFEVETITWEKQDPNDKRSEKKEIHKSHTLREGEESQDSYSITKWSYLEGLFYVRWTYVVTVVDGEVALKQSKDPVIKAQTYVEMGEYEKADAILADILAPDPNHYYFVNKQANELQAYRYEFGLGVKKDLDKAYKHYLFARSFNNVARFMGMGYGKGVFEEDYRLIEWCEYHVLKLLHAIGEREYAEYVMNWNANYWIYDSEEKEADKYSLKFKSIALCRKQVCEWMMERKKVKEVDAEKFALYLGAYCSYLKNGHEGACSYVHEDWEDGSKSNQTSTWRAINYIEESSQQGDELAIRGLEFIQSLKGNKQ